MFKLQRYILREHVGPFFFTFFILMFIFIIKFLLQYSDRLLGKGLPLFVILEFVFVNLAWMIALTIPMSVLVATLMSFGRLSADNEVVALKSSGITIYKMLQSPLVGAAVLALFMVWFNDQILPELNHRSRIMLNEVTRKKPTLYIEPGVFVKLDNGRTQFIVQNIQRELVDSLSDEQIITGPKYPHFRDRMINITIFTTENNVPKRTVTAEHGYMIFDELNARIILTLFSGEVHERVLKSKDEYRRSHFDKNTIFIPAREFVLDQGSSSDYRTDREMGIKMMRDQIAEYKIQEEKYHLEIAAAPLKLADPLSKRKSVSRKNKLTWINAVSKAKNEIKSTISNMSFLRREISVKRDRQNQLEVEVQKKYSIPFACLVFILIGAPLGIMARKGGLGIGFSLSVAFFLIYWVSLILGESLADKRIISPYVAMWGANIIVGVSGFYLILTAVKELHFINWDKLVKMLKLFRKKESNL